MTDLLLLWDIDGTLLASGGAGMRGLEQAISKRFLDGEAADLSTIDWAGRTDRWIAQMIFEKYGIEHSQAAVDELLDTYIAALPEHLSKRSSVLPGIHEILEHADGCEDITQGLLTGNMERGAATKLGHFDLWRYFAFGAFADDSAWRNDLGPHALRRAAAHRGAEFEPRNVWIIGDTPHDIECGKVIGANTLAVATGHHSADQLAAHEPSALLPDLGDTQVFWRTVGR